MIENQPLEKEAHSDQIGPLAQPLSGGDPDSEKRQPKTAENFLLKRQRTVIALCLALIIVVGGGLRLYNLRWDLGTFPHPDERSSLLFYATQIRWPENIVNLLDPRQSTLNPFWDVPNQHHRSYTYGHFPLYTLVLTSALLTRLTPFVESINASPETIEFFREAATGLGYAVVGRALVALLDTLSVYLVFLIARRLYGPWAGLLAATLSALAVFHIQLAHFFAVDPVSTTFVLLTIYASMLMFERRTIGPALLAGVAIGLAVSSKYSSLPVALVPATAGLLIIRDADNEKGGGVALAVRLVSLAALTSLVMFALTSPFVLLDYENFHLAVVEEQGAMVSGAADLPYTRQYRNTTPYLYFIEQQVRWGLGWPLGLLAFAGLAWGLLRGIGGRLRAGEWLILAWVVPYFSLNGLFLAKFMRYMSPVTPLIIILGAGMLVLLARKSPQGWPMARPLAFGVAGVVLLGTLLWTAMFVNGVYATEHSWVTTSRWIYANVPDGACIAREHWEEGLPRDWAWAEPGMSPGNHAYFQPELPMYDPDTQQKFERIRDTLRGCDYLVIASNRMTRTLPRLVERYPMSTKYYQALFAGELGYELVFEQATPPRLGPFVVDDQPADESFTVYDHPKAFVFKNVRDLSEQEWFNVLGDTWPGAVHGYVGKPTLLMRLRGAGDVPASENDGRSEEKNTWLQKPLREWPLVSDWRWNTAANDSPVLATVVWWLAVQVIGLAAFPIAFALFTRLADRGYLLSKSLGLLLVSYGPWLLAGIGLPANRLPVIVGVLILMAVISLSLARRQMAEARPWWRARWSYILLGELIFAAVFVLFVGFRAANPDLWQPWRGGEKMLEIGFLNAIVKSATMPPYDPFFAGTFINYYYYGLYIAGVMVKLTGIQPVIAFNLAVPMLAGLTAINVFSLAGSLAQRKSRFSIPEGVVAGLLAVLFVVFFSNLDGMGQFLRNLAEVGNSDFKSAIPGLETLVGAGAGFVKALGGAPVREYDFWEPSRVIPATINEFPFWSFLFADLHPHMIGIPFTVLFLSLAYNWLKSAPHLIRTRIETLAAEPAVAPPQAPPSGGRGGAVVGPGTFAFEIVEPAGRETTYRPPLDSASNLWAELQETATQELANLNQAISLGMVGRWLALPFVLGALAVINTWDLPTYLGLMCAAFALSRYRAGLRPLTLGRSIVLLAEVVGFGLALLAMTLLLYRPFFAHYFAQDVGLGLVKDKIPFDEFFKLWGFFLVILCTWLVWQVRRPQSRFAPLRAFSLFLRRWNVLPHLIEIYRSLVTRADAGYKNVLIGIGLLLAVSLALMALKYYVVALTIPWVVIACLLLWRWELSAEQSFVELLAFTGLLVLLGVQFVFLRDFLGGGDHYRMNTYFKFFIQVWVLFGVAAAAMLPSLWRYAERWSWGWRWAWQMTVIVLAFSSLVFFVLGTRQRLDYRFPGPRPTEASLNGMDYMTVGQFEWNNVTYDLKYDYQAIRWLQDNVEGTPIIAEAKIGYYREWGMRVAAYTGLPSILGGLHQGEQHPGRQLGSRDELVNRFWFETDRASFMKLARELGVDYIYFGQLERALYGDHQAQKLEHLRQAGLLEVVFENERTRIYRAVDGAR